MKAIQITLTRRVGADETGTKLATQQLLGKLQKSFKNRKTHYILVSSCPLHTMVDFACHALAHSSHKFIFTFCHFTLWLSALLDIFKLPLPWVP